MLARGFHFPSLVYSSIQARIPKGNSIMLKFMFACLILVGIYFCAVGFLRTAGKFGWDENARNTPTPTSTHR